MDEYAFKLRKELKVTEDTRPARMTFELIFVLCVKTVRVEGGKTYNQLETDIFHTFSEVLSVCSKSGDQRTSPQQDIEGLQ